MEAVVANVDNVKFDIEVALEQQLGAQPLPFVGMDKSTSAICEFFIEGSCAKASQCPFRHVRGDRTVVCKHWLRGLCKKGDQCEFLHEYDMTKMPECYFYTRFNACHNKECPFLHIDPESKVRPCPWYDRGFCRHGPHCRHKHIRKVLCLNYLAGFCPEGPDCKFVHAQFDLPQIDETALKARKAGIICHVCGEAGHKSYQCPKNPELMGENNFHNNSMNISSISSKTDPDDSSSSLGPEVPSNNNMPPMIERVERNPAFPRHHLSDQQNHHHSMPHHHQQQQQPPPMSHHQPPHHHHHPPHHEGGHGPRGRGRGDGNFNTYQPYQFHPRPPFFPRGHHHRNENRNRDENRGERGEQGEQQPRRALEDVVCYKCGYKGHYANKCNKGHLAFLSHKAGHNRDKT